MITNPMARALRNMLIPRDQLFAATVTLLPSSNSPVSLTCSNCWWKPLDVKLVTYNNVMIESLDRLIHIPAEAINSSGAVSAAPARWIRELDTIVAGGVTFVVKTSRLISVSSVWECLVKEMPA